MEILKKLKEQIEIAEQLDENIRGLKTARRFVTDKEKRDELLSLIEEKKTYMNFTIDSIQYMAGKMQKVEMGQE